MGEVERIKAVYEAREAAGLAARYSLFRPDALHTQQAIERGLIRTLSRAGLEDLADKHILDVGCGEGRRLQRMLDYGASAENLRGVDLRENVIAAARELNPGIEFSVVDGKRLLNANASQDIVMQFTVFTSILDSAMKSSLASEMLRVLRPGGLIIWFDYLFNNPNNRDVRGIRKPEIQRLFPGCNVRLKRTVLAPPLARR
ncbi:MAG: class I SAM-dependent methyltransferase, partial [Phycisphaerae bacterium]|nr:class I SAM-dependent methyltransferase [Phycisphaerae bacterium]